MDSLLSFPVGLFHPLQHAGLSRRTPNSRLRGQVDSKQPGGRQIALILNKIGAGLRVVGPRNNLL